MRHDLNFHPHVILAQARDTNTCPQRLMIRHPALEIAHHGSQGLVIDGDVIRVHPVDLGPTLATRIFESSLHVLKSQVNLRIDFLLELSSDRIPSAWTRRLLSMEQFLCGGKKAMFFSP